MLSYYDPKATSTPKLKLDLKEAEVVIRHKTKGVEQLEIESKQQLIVFREVKKG